MAEGSAGSSEIVFSVDTESWCTFDFPQGYEKSPYTITSLSGEKSDVGLVDFTFFTRRDISNHNWPRSPAKVREGLVWHPLLKDWVRPGSFKQPSAKYIKKMYNAAIFHLILCWDSTYGCFILDQYLNTTREKDIGRISLTPGWIGANLAWKIGDYPGLPIGEEFKSTTCNYKYPRFIGYYAHDLKQESVDLHNNSISNESYKGRPENDPKNLSMPVGERPSDDAVYDWWENKWVRPGDNSELPGIPAGELQPEHWYIFDTALGVFREHNDWKKKPWLDDYSSLIIDGIVAYGGLIYPSMASFGQFDQPYGDRYLGCPIDSEYCAHADAERARLIRYMRGES